MTAGQTPILVINCGSSSLKYEIFAMPEQTSLGRGLVERIGEPSGRLTQQGEATGYLLEEHIPDHQAALQLMAQAITHKEKGLLPSLADIQGIGHRVVHGGEHYSASVLIDDKVTTAIEANSELAPLHNPANLAGIRAAAALMPNLDQVAVFDTAFHQTLPPWAYYYGLPLKLYNTYKIRRYGFHGTSHRYVAGKAISLLKRSPENTNVISCHLGNGASVTAIENGCSVDTSMGFTPLEGLMMGTRSGDIDPSIIFFLLERGYTPEQLNTMLNKKSGLLGLSGISKDLRDVEQAAQAGNQAAKHALEAYAYRIKKYIGAYAAVLVKVDILVFTGGIGQHGVSMRGRICRRLENIGIFMDYDRNQEVGSATGTISTNYSRTTIVVVPTREELQIAIDTFKLIRGESQKTIPKKQEVII